MFMKKKWWKEAVAYQVYPRSFMDANGDGIGDLPGMITKLDYLKDLGIDIIWICPVYKSPNDDNGYDISDYQDIMQEFGTMADFDQLLTGVHRRGMKLIIDLVINHTSDEHPWFVESRSSRDNPKRDWYIWRDAAPPRIGKETEAPNNWESIFGGSAWEYDQGTDQYFLHLFSRRQPDLNWENTEMREAVYAMINWWMDKGVDGFRIDAISHIKKEEGFLDMPNPDGLSYVPSYEKHMNVKGVMDYIREIDAHTFSHYPIMTVGEANGVKASEATEWVGEDEPGKFSMIFQFEFKSLWDTEKSEKAMDIREYKRIQSKWQKALATRGWNALYIENHDMTRVVSSQGDDGVLWRESATAWATMYFLMRGTPFIYQGQEIGMTNVQFPTIDQYDCVNTKNMYRLRTAQGVPHEQIMEAIWETSRDNSRTPMQWDDRPNAGFSTGVPWMGVNPNYARINVAQQWSDPQSILHFYKKLIQLRKSDELWVYGAYELIMEKNKQIYAYVRTLSSRKAIVLCNLTDQNATYRYTKYPIHGEQLVLSNYEVAMHTAVHAVVLRPYEARVYVVTS